MDKWFTIDQIDEDTYIEALRKVRILPYEKIEYTADSVKWIQPQLID